MTLWEHDRSIAVPCPLDGTSLNLNYGWCKTHSSGFMYHLILTCYAYASHGLEHNYVWWPNRDAINVFLLPCHACHIWHICLATYVGPTRPELGSGYLESGSGPSHNRRSTTVHAGQTDPMELASNTWRRLLHYPVCRITHRKGIIQHSGRPSGL